MGEARRRKAHEQLHGAGPISRIEVTAGLEAMQREGQGLYTVAVYTIAELLALSARVDAGDTTANSDMIVAGSVFRDFFDHRGTSQERPCWYCHRPLVRPRPGRQCGVVTITAAVDQPMNVAGGIVCSECFTAPEELRDKIEADMRAFDPALRKLDISSDGGRA